MEGISIYNNYALASAFGIQEHSSRKSIDGECWLRKEFVCCKQGKKREDGKPKPNKKGKSRDALSTLRWIREVVVKSLL